MAKSELKVKPANKRKRKHGDAPEDDEIPAKSLIVESKHEDAADVEQAVHKSNSKKGVKKSAKRKHAPAAAVKTKRTKKASSETSDDDEEEQSQLELDSIDQKAEYSEHYKPTLEELKESERIRQLTAGQTLRQKKREKHQQRVEIQKDQSADKEKQRNDIYLQKWKNSRSEWKFEKLRQISIQQSILDETKIDDSIWPVALEYLSGTKGAAKDKLVALAEAAIEQVEKEDNGQRGQLIETAKYQRARELLQTFV